MYIPSLCTLNTVVFRFEDIFLHFGLPAFIIPNSNFQILIKLCHENQHLIERSKNYKFGEEFNSKEANLSNNLADSCIFIFGTTVFHPFIFFTDSILCNKNRFYRYTLNSLIFHDTLVRFSLQFFLDTPGVYV